jgi:ribosomal-protein-alanine N-acetyltransferase
VDGLVLALDAGSPRVSVAVGWRGEALAARSVPLERSSTQLLALVDEVLAAAGARAADLTGIVALAGPGSFTGLRVGLATALGLYQALGALGVRALALPTLAAMAAASGAPPDSVVIAAVDALRGEWSAQAFRAGSPSILPTPPTTPTSRRSPIPPFPPTSPFPQVPPTSPPLPFLRPTPLGAMALLPAEDLLRRLATAAGRDGGQDGEGKDEGEDASPVAAEGPTIVAFGVAALRQAAGGAAATASFVEAPPLATAALWLAAAVPAAAWRATALAAPIYSRPPATTAPRRRAEVPLPPGAAAAAGEALTVPPPIRPARAADLPALAALEAAAFGDPWSAAMLAAELSHPRALILVAPGRAGGTDLDAYACFLEAADEAELLRVAVAPARRRQGLALRLLGEGFGRLRAAGVVSCHLEVRPANLAALGLYQALGFAVCGRRRLYYRDGSDALVLRRAL